MKNRDFFRYFEKLYIRHTRSSIWDVVDVGIVLPEVKSLIAFEYISNERLTCDQELHLTPTESTC